MSGTPPTTGSTPQPYTIGQLEGAVVAFFGAFFAALAGSGAINGFTTGGLELAVIAAAGSAATFLGYTGYQAA